MMGSGIALVAGSGCPPERWGPSARARYLSCPSAWEIASAEERQILRS